jgi:5-methylcytosine-specific restriction endonuclease McrA
MTQIAPIPEREPVRDRAPPHDLRRRARIIAAHGGKCAYPGCDETQGLEVDHIIPLALGGKDRDEDMEPLCLHHHASKTKRDMGADRQGEAAGSEAQRRVSPQQARLKGRGFQRRWEPGS